ncbi:MAG: hypothetical protein FJY54_14835 [Betaproteobacteria bacterium]|nr:hypothetical protein [Betaproteobacteria bacterium]
MSALYLFFVAAVWVFLTLLLWRTWCRWRVKEGGSPRTRDAIALFIGALWFGASFWYAGGRTIYYDMEVNRLCKQDGGVKVYEQVKLPAERFDKWGNVGVPNKRHAKPSDDYYFETEIRYLRTGNPSLQRASTVLVRRSDGKVLGESVRYGRGGGDLPGPWHGSSFSCPSIGEAEGSLETSIFLIAKNLK